MGKGIIFTWSGEINPTTDPKQRVMVREGEMRSDLPEDYETVLVEVKGIARWVEPVAVTADVTIEPPVLSMEPAVELEPEPIMPTRRRR